MPPMSRVSVCQSRGRHGYGRCRRPACAWCLIRRVAYVEARCRKVQETLMLRHGFWQETMPKPADVKVHGPEPPTRVHAAD